MLRLGVQHHTISASKIQDPAGMVWGDCTFCICTRCRCHNRSDEGTGERESSSDRSIRAGSKRATRSWGSGIWGPWSHGGV